MSLQRAILQLPIASIAIPAERIGYFNPKHADRLAREIDRDGQNDPIHVQTNGAGAWTLVAGLHRLRAVEKVGAGLIDAIEVADSSASADELARLELSENLDHQHRRPIERAIFMARLARIEEARDHPDHVGESRQARGGRLKAASLTMREAGHDWRRRTADALDCSVQTLERYQRIYRNIVEGLPADAEQINFHPLCSSFAAVNAIAARDNIEARRAIVAKLLERDDWQSMDAVLDAAGVKASAGSRIDPNKPDVAFMTAYGKMKGPRRRVSLLALAEELIPSDVLDMVEVFKKRRIVSENTKIA